MHLEAGPPENHWTVRMPGGLRTHYRPESPFNWHLETQPQAHLDGRRIYQPRGKVLGGSSSINGMVFLRGHRLGAGTLRPSSRGTLELRSSDPREAPRIDPQFLATEADRRDLRAAFRLARETLAQNAFRPFDDGEVDPGPEASSDDEIDPYVAVDGGTVVDPVGRVRGVDALRVVDAAIMPQIVSSNLNAAVMMIGEKLADAFRGRAPPHPG